MGTRERTSTEDRFRTLRHICSLASHVVMSHSPICLHSIGHTRLELTLRLTRRRSAARRSRVRLHRHFRRSGSQTPALDLDLNSGKGQSVGDSPRDPAPLPTRSAQRNFTKMLDRVSKPEWQYEELPAAIRFLQPLTMARSVPRNYSHHVPIRPISWGRCAAIVCQAGACLSQCEFDSIQTGLGSVRDPTGIVQQRGAVTVTAVASGEAVVTVTASSSSMISNSKRSSRLSRRWSCRSSRASTRVLTNWAALARNRGI